jgi:hypothetical protein
MCFGVVTRPEKGLYAFSASGNLFNAGDILRR